jgi:DUF438 domain-containing protein
MSEISNHRPIKQAALRKLFFSIMNQENAVQAIRSNKDLIDATKASDIIELVHHLVQEGIPLPELKTSINKFLNVLGNTIRQMPGVQMHDGTVAGSLALASQDIIDKLDALKQIIKKFSKNCEDRRLRSEILNRLKSLQSMQAYYKAKEIVLFPLIERHWSNFGCLRVMWSFHDDIRRNLQRAIQELEKGDFDPAVFNRLIGDFYFNTYAIHTRDTKLLLPYALEIIPAADLMAIAPELRVYGIKMSVPYEGFDDSHQSNVNTEQVVLRTGSLSIDQIMLIFNNLPVDITLVDEHNKVCFYSDPPHRIFPRSRAIIGRDVRNCHPPESIDTVNAIIDAFRKGLQSEASFWIDMNGRKLMIRYFALRNSDGDYKGTLEVSQDITAMIGLVGERRLLHWNA